MPPESNQTPGPILQAPQSNQQFGMPLPGKTIGILGFVFAFIGLTLPGLILSIISLSQAKKVGRNNGLALAGIILNAVFMVFWTLIIITTTLVSYSAITIKANTAASATAAEAVVKSAEAYSADNGTYPTTYSQISSQIPSTIIQAKTQILSARAASAAETIEFYSCGTDGNKVGYWSYEDSVVDYLYAGNASSSSTCTFVSQ